MFKKCVKYALITVAVFPTTILILALFWLCLLSVLTGNLSAPLIGLFLMVPITTTMHELGHVVAGLAVRLKIQRISVWPLVLSRTAEGFRLTFDWQPRWSFGYVVAMPRDPKRPIRWQMMALFAGGPLATLGLTITCAWLAVVLDGPPLSRWWGSRSWDPTWIPGYLTSWPAFAALLNALIFVGTLTPGKRTVSTDGELLVDWLFAGAAVQRPIWLVQIAATSRTGVRASDWDSTLIEQMLREPDGSAADVAAHRYGYYQALDRNEIELAGQRLDYALEHRDVYSADHRAAITLEGAYFEGFFRRDASKARSWFNFPGADKMEEQTRLRAEAAVLFAEGDLQSAAATAEAALAVVMKSEDAGGAISERDWLTAILNECRKPAQADLLTPRIPADAKRR